MSYLPAIGKWMQEDPIDFAGGDSNLTRVVGNNPTNQTDPSGLKGEDGKTGILIRIYIVGSTKKGIITTRRMTLDFKVIEAELNKIFHNCIQQACKGGAVRGHLIELMPCTEDEYKARKEHFGDFTPGSGKLSKIYVVGMTDIEQPKDGKAGNGEFCINQGFIETDLFINGLRLDHFNKAAALVIAHELWHVIADVTDADHSSEKFWIDSSPAKVGSVWSLPACKKIASALNLPLKD